MWIIVHCDFLKIFYTNLRYQFYKRMQVQPPEDSEHLLAQLSKSEREEIRIREKMFKGKQYVDIRICK